MRSRRNQGKRTLEAVPDLASAWFGRGVPCAPCIILRGGPSLPGFLGADGRCPVSLTWPVGTHGE